jgi:hypothetical protein
VRLFLLSLKAGGTGLNLTAADTVIHYDPWWNPAAENQATDRAHRIGQKKAVFVFKLIASGTIEECMVELQERKKAIAEGMYGVENALPSQLTSEDLESLFAPLSSADEEPRVSSVGSKMTQSKRAIARKTSKKAPLRFSTLCFCTFRLSRSNLMPSIGNNESWGRAVSHINTVMLAIALGEVEARWAMF